MKSKMKKNRELIMLQRKRFKKLVMNMIKILKMMMRKNQNMKMKLKIKRTMNQKTQKMKLKNKINKSIQMNFLIHKIKIMEQIKQKLT